MEQVIKANVFPCLGSQLVPQQDRFGHPSLISQLRHTNRERANKQTKKDIYSMCLHWEAGLRSSNLVSLPFGLLFWSQSKRYNHLLGLQ